MEPADPPNATRSGATGHFSADSLLQAAFLAGDNPVFLVDMESRRILACNGAVRRVFGHTPEDLVGRDTRILHTDDAAYERFGRESEAVLRGNAGSYHGHFRMRRRNATDFPSEHLVHIIRDDAGAPCAVVSIVRDLSAAEPEDLSVSCSKAGFRFLGQYLPGALYQRIQSADGTSRFTVLTGSLFRDHGLDPERIRADPEELYSRILPADREELKAALARGRTARTAVECEVRLRAPDGKLVSLRILTQPRVLDDDSTIWDGVALDITTQRSAEEQFHYLATHDALTGLLNRPQFLQHLQWAVDMAARNGQRLVVVTMGIHAMMRINAAHGLGIGDELLRQVGARLQTHCSGNDLTARGHGDVFFVMRVLGGNARDARHVLDGLAQLFDEPFDLGGGTTVAASVRMGLAAYPEDAGDAASLLNDSSIAFDRCARDRRVGYEFYAEELGRELRERGRREDALAEAIARGEVVPYFQPQVSLLDGSLVGLEALARWPRPDGTLVPPGEFIPLAEASNLILSLDYAILKAVISWIREWWAAGFGTPPVAINCSARQFRNANLPQVLRQALAGSGLDSSQLIIEITESSLLEDIGAAERTMTALTGMGIRFSIDDFGTGFSSLSYLAHLPFSSLKIDRTFVATLGTNERLGAISSLLVNMGRSLGLAVIAEGVEEQAQAAHLKRIGCPAAQGFLYAAPMPGDAVTAWLPRVRHG